MNLFEYIKSQLPSMPNASIMKDMGASDELIKYVKETPWNTNLNMIGSITGSDDGEPKVWLVGNTYEDLNGMKNFILSNFGDVDHMTELLTNSSNYEVYLNGELLPYIKNSVDPVGLCWFNAETFEHATKGVNILGDSSGATKAQAICIGASTELTFVEVSVKAK